MPMRKAPRNRPCVVGLLAPIVVFSLVTSVLGATDPGSPCVPASQSLQTYASRLDRFWGTRTTLLVCDGARVQFGSQARRGIVYFVPDQARDLNFDGLGIVYIIAHEWGHQVQSQRLGLQNAFSFTQHIELQA